MKRFLRIGLIGLFFSAQTLALVHTAKHGFVDHDHDGRSCDVVLFVKAFHAADAPSVAVAIAPDILSAEPVRSIADVAVVVPRDRAFPPRAPPVLCSLA